MESVQVSEGVYWINIPGANLRILCGCPADSVKHLMRMGLIAKRQQDGREYETGPNAILLADTSSQNGGFSNLAEFPVLQIFYRQGSILPKHPNNDGTRPLLIGSPAQVKAQIEYMDIGKYGIVEPKELEKIGLDATEIRELLAVKTRFAFGRMESVGKLLDTRLIDREESELRDGVFIRRKEINVFEIRHGGETLEINLNLAQNKIYEPAVRLDYHSISREYFSIVHMGEGDGWDPYRPCMGSLLCYQGKLYLIDAGPHILRSLTALGISASEIEGVFQTHAHDDHFAGLPTLARADHRIKFYATPLVRASVMKKASALMGLSPQRFEAHFEPVNLEAERWNDLDGLEVMPIPSPHPVETTAFYFRVFWEGGYRTYGHLADIIAFDTLGELAKKAPKDSGFPSGLLERTRTFYHMKADVKKIDAGGGMIHGAVADFSGDPSGKILIAHKAEALTDAEKEIGSDAVFGSQDVLIPATQDYAMRTAARHLTKYYPEAPDHERSVLLNCPVVSYNAGENLLRRGERSLSVFLLLSGVAEIIDTAKNIHHLASSGTFMAEYTVLAGQVSDITFRAASYVKALCIPAELYLRFISRNYAMDATLSFHQRMVALKSSHIFGDMIASTVLSSIARSMVDLELEPGSSIDITEPELILVRSGEVAVSFGEVEVEHIGPGGIYGEESILLKNTAMGSARATSAVYGYRLPAGALEGVPVVEWKLLETYERRIAAFAIQLGT